jgi:tight adherence protein C
MTELFLLFSGLGLLALSVYLFTQAILTNNTDAQSLAWASGKEPVKSESGFINFSRPLVHNFTLQHALRVKNPDYRKRVEKKLLTAGLSQELNVDEFIGLQILWGIGAPVVLVILNLTMQLGYPYWFCMAMGVFGFLFPHLHCKVNTEKRYLSVIADLPFFIDLLALSTEAGLDFVAAIQRIVDKADPKSVLAIELSTVMKDIKIGSARADAMKALATRLDIPEITSFVAVVNDSDFTGAPISGVLKQQSIQMRMERFVRAEKAGSKAATLMLLPMVGFILPAIFVVVFAPVVLGFMTGGK